MVFLDALEKIYRIACFTYLFYVVITEFLKIFIPKSEQIKEQIEKKTEEKVTFEDRYLSIRAFLGGIGFVVFTLLLVIEYKYIWILILVLITLGMKILGNVYASTGIIKGIVKSPKGTKTNSSEKIAIVFVSLALYYVETLNVWEKLFAWLDATFVGVTLDILKIIIMCFICFYNVFFISILFVMLCIFVFKYIEKYTRIVSDRLSVWCRKVISLEDKSFVSDNSFLSKFLTKLKTQKMKAKYIRYYLGFLLIPIAVIGDLIWTIFSLFISSVLILPISGILVFFRLLKNTFLDFCVWICSRSEKVIIAFSFRLSIIVAFVFIVVTNRLEPIFTNYEPYTAILEFVASAIIIPVIFDWLYSLKNIHSKEKE